MVISGILLIVLAMLVLGLAGPILALGIAGILAIGGPILIAVGGGDSTSRWDGTRTINVWRTLIIT